MSPGGRRFGIASIVVIAAAILVLPGPRRTLLRGAGWTLVSNDPVESADVIVIAIDVGVAGILEAADLVQAGVSSRVAVFDDPPDSSDLELLRRGVTNEDRATWEIRKLQALGVANVERIQAVVGTEDEGGVLPGWCDRQHIRSIVMVSGLDHSRRLRRVLGRAMKDHQTRVIVRGARYSSFNPDSWWYSRGGVRTEIVELEKLLFDFVRHPFS